MAPTGSKLAAAQGESSILSKQCEEVLRGGSFDARAFLKRARTTGDAGTDEEELARFRAKLKVVDMLNHHPEHCLGTQQRLQDDIQGLSASAQRKSKSEDVFEKSIRKVGKIDAEWRGAFLAKSFSACGLDLGALKELDRVCSDTLSQVFDFIVATTPDTAITDEMRDKVLCERVFCERANALGRMSKKWVKSLLEHKGNKAPDWSKIGCYLLAGTGSAGWTVKHCSGAEVRLVCRRVGGSGAQLAVAGAPLQVGHLGQRLGVSVRSRPLLMPPRARSPYPSTSTLRGRSSFWTISGTRRPG